MVPHLAAARLEVDGTGGWSFVAKLDRASIEEAIPGPFSGDATVLRKINELRFSGICSAAKLSWTLAEIKDVDQAGPLVPKELRQ